MYLKFLSMATFLTVPVSTAGVVNLPVPVKFQSSPNPIILPNPQAAVLQSDLEQGHGSFPVPAARPLVDPASSKRSLWNQREGKVQGLGISLDEGTKIVTSAQIPSVSLDNVGIIQPVALVQIPVREKSPTGFAVPASSHRGSGPKSDQALQAMAVDVQISSGRAIRSIDSVADLRPVGKSHETGVSQLPDASMLQYRTTARNAYKVYFPYNDGGIANLNAAGKHPGATTYSQTTASNFADRILEDGYYSYPTTDDHNPVAGLESASVAKERQRSLAETFEPAASGKPAIPTIPILDLDAEFHQGENANVL